MSEAIRCWNHGTVGELVAVDHLETIKLHAQAAPAAFGCDAHDVACAPQRGHLAIHRIRHVQQNIDYCADANGMVRFKKDADIRDVFRLRGVLIYGISDAVPKRHSEVVTLGPASVTGETAEKVEHRLLPSGLEFHRQKGGEREHLMTAKIRKDPISYQVLTTHV